MSGFDFATLTPEQAHSAATGYGWSVLPHDNGGFLAQRGPHRMIVTFDEHRAFRCAHLREGVDGFEQSLTEGAVIGQLAMRGAGPRSDGEPTPDA